VNQVYNKGETIAKEIAIPAVLANCGTLAVIFHQVVTNQRLLKFWQYQRLYRILQTKTYNEL
jgi:hypothetical protein